MRASIPSRILRSLLIASLIIPFLATASATLADDKVRRLEQQFFVGEAERLHVNFSIGNLQIEGTEGRDIEVVLELDCTRSDVDNCRRRAERVRLVSRVERQSMKLRLRGTSRGRARGIKADMRLRVPHQLALEVDVAAGDVTVRGMASSLEIDGVAGDAKVSMAESQVGSVDINVGVGQVELHVKDSVIKGTGFPRSLEWKGQGASHIEIDLGTGDATVRLE